MNYIKINNWFWQEVPYMDGFKVQYGFLFFAILDSINRNHWAPWTRIAYDNLINKCPTGKRLYLEGRQWLIDQNLIEMIPGKNAYQMVSFRLGIAVQKGTTVDTTIDTTVDTTIDTTVDTTIDTNNAPLQAPIIKRINNKLLKHKTDKQTVNIAFDTFWNLYDKKKGNKQELESLWLKLTDEERSLAINHIVPYKLSTPDKQYRKDPKTYLIDESFNDEIINSNGNTNGNYSSKPGNYKQKGRELVTSELVKAVAMEGY